MPDSPSHITCSTPRCMGRNGKFNWIHPYPYGASVDGSVHRCESCGGITHDNGKTWEHKCAKCHQDVEPGQLTGRFVPHKCPSCEKELADAQIAAGNVCRLCRQPYSRCCC